jgi:hypothetical protein
MIGGDMKFIKLDNQKSLLYSSLSTLHDIVPNIDINIYLEHIITTMFSDIYDSSINGKLLSKTEIISILTTLLVPINIIILYIIDEDRNIIFDINSLHQKHKLATTLSSTYF